MPSFKVTALAIVALFTSAQADYYITPTTVPIATRSDYPLQSLTEAFTDQCRCLV
jgi:hypothetical protein